MATDQDNELGETLSITEARNLLTKLPEQLAAQRSAIPLTRRGKPVMALISWDLYLAIQETMEVMGDPELMSALRESIKDVVAGRVRPLEQFEAELGL